MRFGGKYRVDAFLGRGEFGDVFRAWDETLERFVVIKRLLVQEPTAPIKSSERIALARLNHPNIIAIYEAEPEDGYFVMEYAAGGSLESWLTEDRHGARRGFVSWAIDVCQGLGAAHRLQILHRDIKPANILLTEDRSAKLGDFGLAMFLAGRHEHRTRAGTRAYWAPEVHDFEKPEASSDVYSLGVVFYEAWTGRLPFNSELPLTFALRQAERRYPTAVELSPETPTAISELISNMITPRAERLTLDAVLNELQVARMPGRRTLRTIDDFQHQLDRIYGEKNDQLRGVRIVAHLVAALEGLTGGLINSNADYRQARAEAYFPRVFAWLCALLTSMNWSVSRAIWFKYRGKCPYCDGEPCGCTGVGEAEPERNREILERVRDDVSVRSEGLRFYLEMFNRIYGARNRAAGVEYVCLRALLEAGEVVDAVLLLGRLAPEARREHSARILGMELADLIAWFMALVNVYGDGYDFDAAFATMFAAGCYKCHVTPCTCDDEIEELELANWRRFPRQGVA